MNSVETPSAESEGTGPPNAAALPFRLKSGRQSSQSKIENRKSKILPLWPYALYTLVFAAAWLSGMRMTIQYWFFQLLAPEWARERLLESLWYLHMQPPALNLLFGLALKYEALTGLKPETPLLIFHYLLGFAYMRAVAGLTSRFIPNPRVGLAVLLFLLFNPVLYQMAFGFFYTWHETVILAALAWEVWRYLEEPSARRYLPVCAWMIALVYTRSLFHFVWAGAALAALAWAGRDTWPFHPRRARGVLTALALTTVTLLAWPAKNYALFGVFGYSSWTGYNLSEGIIRDLMIPEDPTPEKYRAIPALAERYKKSKKDENWNRWGVIGAFEKLGREALGKIHDDPSLLVRKMIRNYWNTTRFAGRHPHYGGFGEVAIPSPVMMQWMRVYESVFFFDARLTMNLGIWSERSMEPPKPWHVSGFLILLPVILAISAWWAWRGWRGSDPIRARVTAFLLWAIVWTLAMCLLVDGGEGNRIRFSTESYVALLAGWVISRGLDWRRRKMGAR